MSKDIVDFLSPPPLMSIYINILPAYISVYHLCVNSPQGGQKEGIEYSGTEVNRCELPCYHY